jgi:STE24 endopeptidase
VANYLTFPEMQHWKMGHVTRNLLLANAVLLCQFALFGVIQHNDSVLASFGFEKQRPALARFILFTVSTGSFCTRA